MLDRLLYAKKIAPDLLEGFLARYQVLKTIHVFAPAGRRAVALSLAMTERQVRTEVENLRNQGLIIISKSGMSVTKEGVLTLEALEPIVKSMCGLSGLERQLAEKLGIKRVIIVQGDSQQNEGIKKDMGRVAAKVILDQITKDSIIAITGGSTMAAMVSSMPDFQAQKAALVVAARGSVGGKMEWQADTLAVNLAKKMMAQYRLLHIPDNLGKKALAEMKNEPNIHAAMQEIKQADTLVFGVGSAMAMAKKRRLSSAIMEFLERKQAVAEAFGYYFNSLGEVVYTSRSIGISMENAQKMPHVFLVAGGKNKAPLLLAVCKNMKNSILITDEGAAKVMLS